MLVCADRPTGTAGINWFILTSLSSVSANESLSHIDESLRREREGEELAQGHRAAVTGWSLGPVSCPSLLYFCFPSSTKLQSN